MKKSPTSWVDLLGATTCFVLAAAFLLAGGCSQGEPSAPSTAGREMRAEGAGEEPGSEPQALDVPVEATTEGPATPESPEPDEPPDSAEPVGGMPEQVGAEPAAESSDPAGGAASEGPAAEPPEGASSASEGPQGAEGPAAAGQPTSLDAALAALTIPPDWYDAVEIRYDTNQPWKEARLEIRRLLALGGEACREGIKLTCVYRRKKDIGDGHEYPMYLYMGGEYAWATQAFVEFTEGLLANPDSWDHVHAFLCLASCYSHFGEFDKALATLSTAMTRLPDPPWRIARQADIHDSFGDVYAKMGEPAKAKEHYAEAARLYPRSNQPYGRHLLKRRAAKVQSKLDLLDYRSLETATLRDGSYQAKALGYSGDKDVAVTLTIRSGRIADIEIDHAEKIDQGATVLIPQRIIAAQSLEVDGITGATVTCDAIRDGVFRALKQAGLE